MPDRFDYLSSIESETPTGVWGWAKRLITELNKFATETVSGIAGPSAYDVAVANGFVGTEAAWLASLEGADGVDGVDGVDGTNGTNGTNGTPAWTLAGTWTFASAVPNVAFTGLGAYNELLVLARLVTLSVSGVRVLRVSTNNGASYYSGASDYKNINSNGIESNGTGFSHSTNTASAATLSVHILNTKGDYKIADVSNSSAQQMIFDASASPIDAIRIEGSSGGNLTGGNIRVLAR